jgi:hypothetical protein
MYVFWRPNLPSLTNRRVYDDKYPPLLKSFTLREKPPWSFRELTPIGFDGPLFEWVFPWNLVCGSCFRIAG